MTTDNYMQLTKFREYLDKRLAQSSVNLYITVLKCFIKEGYDFQNVAHYSEFLVKHHNQKRSVYVHDVLKKFIKWSDTDFIDEEKKKVILMLLNDAFKKKYKDPIKKTQLLTIEQIFHVMSNLQYHKHKIIAWLMVETGVRIGDIIRLPRGNIKAVPYVKNGEDLMILEIQFVTKGQKIRKIKIFNQQLIAVLTKYMQEVYLNDSYYFLDFDAFKGKRGTGNTDMFNFRIYKANYDRYYEDLRDACKKSGINPHEFTPHDFRRNWANKVWDMLDRKDILRLKEAMGHADITTTIRYLRQSGLDTEDVFKKASESFQNGRY